MGPSIPAMLATLRKSAAVVAVCAALVLSGCAAHRNLGPLSPVASPAIPSSLQEIPNPLRGQYEDLLLPLFPQSNPAQKRYPAWPASMLIAGGRRAVVLAPSGKPTPEHCEAGEKVLWIVYRGTEGNSVCL